MITCQGCGQNLMDLGDETQTVARGRYLGWRIFDGTSQNGAPLSVRWCPDCVDKNRPRNPKPVDNVDGQLTFDW